MSGPALTPRAHRALLPAPRSALGSAAAAALSLDSALQQVTSPQCYSHDAIYHIMQRYSHETSDICETRGKFAICMTRDSREIKNTAAVTVIVRGDENTEGNILKKCEESLCLI